MGAATAPAVLAILAALLAACDDPEPKARGGSAIEAPRIERLDPALDAIVPKEARIERVAGGFVFVEGPVWSERDGPHLWFSDLRGNALYRWDPGGAVTAVVAPFYQGARRGNIGPNGLTLDARGRLVVCESGGRRISRIDGGERTVLADRYRGKRLNSPNDLVFKSDGSLYFTDPPHGLPKGDDDPAKELEVNGIYRLDPDGKLTLVGAGQSRPNGIAFSPDEKTLYVSNSDEARNVVYAYGVLADGSLSPATVFVDYTSRPGRGGADGIKVDRNGNVYATGPGGVWILSRKGRHLGTIVLEELPANMAWGDDGSTLYITANTGLYRVALTARGVRPDPGRAGAEAD